MRVSRSSGRRLVAATLAATVSVSPAFAQSFDSGSTGADGALRISVAGHLNDSRYDARATLLPDGRVLITGGWNGGPVSTAELFEPGEGRILSAPGLVTGRAWHAQLLLPDGRVFIAGGSRGGNSGLTAAEIYDPATGTFKATGNMNVQRSSPAAVLLTDGRILVTGGYPATKTAEIYDPATGVFTPTGEMAFPRYDHRATRLSNGQVLVTGGYSVSAPLDTAEIYDPVTGQFTPTGSMTARRYSFSATALQDGTVLLAGGYDGVSTQQSAETYDPATGKFTATGPMSIPRYTHSHGAVLLPDGRVVVSGGHWSNNGYRSEIDLYNPATRTFQSIGGLSLGPRGYHTATLLKDGRVLFAAGHNNNGYMGNWEVYDPISGLSGVVVFDPASFSPPRDADGDGVYHFTSVHINALTTVRLSSTKLPGPVHWLVSGPVQIDGTIDLSGRRGHARTRSAMLRVPAEPGPGGFPGGIGGNNSGSAPPQPGAGPGGGTPGRGGTFTGNEFLVPLVGGSGGGGGDIGGGTEWGQGGGGGGGALLIASSNRITITGGGSIIAYGGETSVTDNNSTCAGGGAGGAIRLVAPVLEGSGRLDVSGIPTRNCQGTSSEYGRIRLEAYRHDFTGPTSGAVSKGSPLATFVPTTLPARVRVVRVGGVAVAANPTGSFDLPDATINRKDPALVEVEARQVPPGTVVKLHLFSLEGKDQIVDCPPLAGTLEQSTTSVAVTFPPGFTRGYARAVWR